MSKLAASPQKTIHKTKDKNHARRITAMLMLHRGDTVSYVARTALLCPFIDWSLD
ncbi:transposase [Escherichia coli]|nr:transposase [Escherichia coli]